MIFPGHFKGRVIDKKDPLKKGRVRVEIPSLGTGGDNEPVFQTDWLPVEIATGSVDTPDVGDIVTVSFGEFALTENDGYVTGVLPREDYKGTPLVPNPAKGVEDYPDDLGLDSFSVTPPPLDDSVPEAPNFSEEGADDLAFQDSQSFYDVEKAWPNMSARQQSWLRYEFDPDNQRMRFLTKNGNQLELGPGGLNLKGDSISQTVRGRETVQVQGNKGESIGRFRFLKVGGGEKIETKSRSISALRLMTSADIERKEIRLHRAITVKGWSDHTVGLQYSRSVGKDTNIVTFSEKREVLDKKMEFIGGASALALGPGTAASDLNIITAGNSCTSLLTGNYDILFTNPLNRVRIGYTSAAGAGTNGLAPLGVPLFNEELGAALLSPLGVSGAHSLNAVLKGSFVQALVTFLTAIVTEIETLVTTVPQGSVQFSAIASTIAAFIGTLESDMAIYPASTMLSNSLEVI